MKKKSDRKKEIEYTKMTQAEALDALRSKKDEGGTMEALIYFLTQDSPDDFKKSVEKQAASMMSIGSNMMRIFAAADKDPELQKIMRRKMKQVKQEMSQEAQKSKDTKETDSKDRN